jgi:peptide/nickel transport system substrate-binding protein
MIASYHTNGAVKLVRNPRFREWSAAAQPDGFPDVISLRAVDATAVDAEVRAIERRAADVALSLVPPLSKTQLDRLATRYPSQLHMSVGASTSYFFLNTRVPPFDDVGVRRAVNYAFDRQAFAQLLGRAFAPTCQILPPNFPSYRRSCQYLPGGLAGLDRARRLVRNSGTSGATVTVLVPAPIAVQGRFMVSILDSLGFRARLKTIRITSNLGPYFNRIMDSRLRVQTGYIGWNADFPSDVSFIHDLFACAAFVPGSPASNTDPSAFCNPSVDRQMARAAAVQAQDPPAAVALWQKVEREILAQAPMVPTYNGQVVDFVSKRVGNYEYHPQWGALLDQLWVR